jgi:hypothetical protein
MKRAALVAAAFAALAFLSNPASAQPKDAREQARALGERGVALLNEGKYAEALSDLEKADGLYHATTLTFYIGECNKYLGHLLEARAAFEKVVSDPLPPDASGPIRASHEKAKAELAGIGKRIPWIAIELVPDERQSANITVDGKPVSADKIGHVDLNPGIHSVEAARVTGGTSRATVTLKEGENKSVRLEFAATAPTGPALATPSEAAVDVDAASGTKHPLRVPGVVVLAVGGTSLVVGVVVGAASIAKVNAFKGDCSPNGSCPKSDAPLGASANTFATVSDIAFIVGGVGVAAGVTLVLWPGKKSDPNATTGLALRPGPGSLSLSGQF